MTRWTCSTKFLARPGPNGTLHVVDPESGGHTTLNWTARLFVERVGVENGLEQVLDHFQRRFALSRDELRRDLLGIAGELERLGILVRNPDLAEGAIACT